MIHTQSLFLLGDGGRAVIHFVCTLSEWGQRKQAGKPCNNTVFCIFSAAVSPILSSPSTRLPLPNRRPPLCQGERVKRKKEERKNRAWHSMNLLVSPAPPFPWCMKNGDAKDQDKFVSKFPGLVDNWVHISSNLWRRRSAISCNLFA